MDEQLERSVFPKEAFALLDAIENAGFEAWLVGGCVRDAILGRRSNDVDIATSASWQEVAGICNPLGMKTHETGVKHGTITVCVPSATAPAEREGREDCTRWTCFEVTTYRIDSPTSKDGRHPDSIEFTRSIGEDLARRDFAMNAIAWHPERGVLDLFDGMEDIKSGIIRSIGDPRQRFREDALRILRACRFSSQLGFEIDSRTMDEMVRCKSLLLKISRERIRHEMDLLLMGAHVRQAIMECADVLEIVLPELVSMKGCQQVTKYHCYDVLEHTAYAVQQAKPDIVVRWAALCHDMGKPSCAFFDADGVEHFYGHAKASARIAKGMFDRLGMTPAFSNDVCTIIDNHSDKVNPDEKSVKRALMRIGGDVRLFRLLLELKKADILAHAPEYRQQASDIGEIECTLDRIVASEEAFSVRHLAVDGNDIMALGIPAGPEVGRILEALLEAVVEGEADNAPEPLLLLAETISKQ